MGFRVSIIGILIVTTLCFVSFSYGQVDFFEGTIGIYFDEAGTIACEPDTASLVQLYIVLETEETQVLGFQTGIQCSPGCFPTSIDIGGDALNVGDLNNLIVGYGTPRVVADGVVVLAGLSVYVMNSGGVSLADLNDFDHVAFLNLDGDFVGPMPEYGFFGLEFPMFTFGLLECPEELPSNGLIDPVFTSYTTWGSIKSFYFGN